MNLLLELEVPLEYTLELASGQAGNEKEKKPHAYSSVTQEGLREGCMGTHLC